MGQDKKSLVLLLSLVLSIYYLRSADLSPTGMFFNKVRILYSTYVTDVCGENDPYDLFTQAQRDSATSLQETIKSSRGGKNELADLVSTGTFAGSGFIDYAMTLVMGVVIPLAAMVVITFIGYDCCMCNWCCMYGCCKSCCHDGCCRCCKPPKTSRRRTIYLILALLFCVAIFGASIAGVVAAGGLQTGVQKTTCSAISFMDTVSVGNQTEGWIGIGPALTKMIYISDQFSSVVNSLSSQTYSTTNLDTKYNDAITDIDSLYNTYKKQEYTLPDPAHSTTKYTVSFSADGTLGPSSDTNTACGAMKAEFDIKKEALTIALKAINDAIDTMKGQTTTIQNALDSGKDTAQSINNSINDLLSSISSTFVTVNDIGGIMKTVAQVIFIISLVFGVAALASILFVKMCKIACFNKVTHFTWCILGLFTFLGFLLTCVLYPVSIVFAEVCGVLDLFLNDKTFFNNVVSSFKLSSFGDTLYTCIYDDGDILKKFNVQDQLGYFDTIFAQLGNTSTLFGSGVVLTSPTITAAQTAVADFKSGKTPDATDTATDLATLNTFTNNGCSDGSPVPKDTWVFGSTTCASGSTVLKSSDSSSTNLGSDTCIGFDQWGSGTAKTGAGRYTVAVLPTSCTQANSQNQNVYVSAFVDNFKTNRASVSTYFTNVDTALTDIANDNTAFMGEVTSLSAPFDNINTTLTNIFDAIRNPTTGIISNAKCSFFASALRRFKDALCIGLVLTMYQVAVCLIVVCAFTLLGTFFIFCFAKRALVKDDESAKA